LRCEDEGAPGENECVVTQERHSSSSHPFLKPLTRRHQHCEPDITRILSSSNTKTNPPPSLDQTTRKYLVADTTSTFTVTSHEWEFGCSTFKRGYELVKMYFSWGLHPRTTRLILPTSMIIHPSLLMFLESMSNPIRHLFYRSRASLL